GMNRMPEAAATVQRKVNNTGLPDQLKTGVEHLSGISMNDVRVHYNSPKPAQLQAHAYAQGTDIHIAPGQEQHLPHEAWHVVQQKQGRVRPTMQLKGKVNVNDDKGLEQEADVMGARALQKNYQVQRSAILQRAYDNRFFNTATLRKPFQLYGNKTMQPKTGLPGIAIPLTNNGTTVAQLFGWNLGSVPGFFVISEGLLSITAGALVAPVNPVQGVFTMLMGLIKLVRGTTMIWNSNTERSKEEKAGVKKGVDIMRTIEGLASAIALITTDQTNKLQFVASCVATALKLTRSLLHFKETDNSYWYSAMLQGIESLEGVALIISGGAGFGKNHTGGGLTIGSGISKTIRGGVAAKVIKNKKDQSQAQALLNNPV
ncbi:MAG: DUF4157 domain-containing protein, partial [Dinghuibacter sp.]|nr:DUF4157 domain-containing protein [Dinghuibacter sp.]